MLFHTLSYHTSSKVKIRYEHIVKVEFADGSSDDDYSD